MKKSFALFDYKKIDSWIVLAAFVYILLPVMIFLMKFTRPMYFIIGLVLFVYMLFSSLKQIKGSSGFSNQDILNKKTLLFLLATIVVFVIWTYFSGIGSFTYQNWDFWVRNPIYNDLISKPWPLYYNLGLQDLYVTDLIGGEWVAFSYYFTYWLTPAFLCKLFSLSYAGCQLVLFVHSLIGLIIVYYLLSRLFNTFSWKITAIFMGFSGLDIVACLLYTHALPKLSDDLEWSLKYFQLSGNTTQLYYVFNQSIPIWIIILLILNLDAPKVTAAIAAICFAYSPWATIGLVPIAIAVLIYKRGDEKLLSRVKNCISLCNILIPLFLLIIYGLYYTASNGSNGGKGLYYQAMGATLSEYIPLFILYVITEFGLYYIAIGKGLLKLRYSIIVFIELTLFPIYYIVDFNFFIRGTIPALFLLMIMVISYIMNDIPNSIRVSNNGFSDDKKYNLRKQILTVLLVIGAFTGIFTFTRSITETLKGGDYLQSDISTFDDMSDANEYQILTVNSQFFVHGFATKPFYLFISKLGL